MILSDKLLQRIEKVAKLQQCSAEDLIESLLDRVEQEKPPQDVHLSQAYLQGVLDSHIDLVCRFTPDTNLTFVNDAYCKFYDCTPEQVIGQSFFILTEQDETAKQWFLDRIYEMKGKPEPLVAVTRVHLPTKEVRWVQWAAQGITDESGDLVEIQGVGRDFTELVLSKRKLEEQTDLLKTVLDNIPVMIVMFAPDGQFEWVNQHWVDKLGWTVEAMRQEPDMMARFYPDPEYRQLALEYMSRAEKGWKDWETTAKDGHVVDSSWANVKLSDGRGLGIGKDISERKAYEKQKLYTERLEVELQKEREMMELRGRILSILSHELKTPLAVILSSVELIERYMDRLSPENLEKKFAGIRYQVDHLVNLLEDVTSLDKTRQNEITPILEELDIEQFCRRTIDNMVLLHHQTHHIYLELTATGIIYADEHLLEHVFTNLLSNAVKYSPPKSTVTLRVEFSDDSWIFFVRDEGIGIPKSDLPHLYSPFFRATNVNTIDGTGLGLSLVYDYVQMHGGSISVDSVEGEGTTFMIILPATMDQPIAQS